MSDASNGDAELLSYVASVSATRLSEAHGLRYRDVMGLFQRVAPLRIAHGPSFQIPRLTDAIEEGVDPHAAIEWLLDCNLDQECALLDAWVRANELTAPARDASELADDCESAAAFLEARENDLLAAGTCESGDGWLQVALRNLYRASLLTLRVEGSEQSNLPTPQDLARVPAVREEVHALRCALVSALATACRTGVTGGGWLRVLETTSPRLTSGFFPLASRLDAEFARLAGEEPVGGFSDLLDLGARVEYALQYDDWRRVRVELLAAGAFGDRGYYALRFGETDAHVQQALVRFASSRARRETYVASRHHAMRSTLRGVARARTLRYFAGLAQGFLVEEASRAVTRWDGPIDGTPARRVTAPERIIAIVVTLDSARGCFCIGGVPLEWDKGQAKPGQLRPGNRQGRALIDIVRNGQRKTTDEDLLGPPMSHMKLAVQDACRKAGQPLVEFDPATYRVTPPLRFDDATERRLEQVHTK